MTESNPSKKEQEPATHMTIVRKEFGYAGIKYIGVDNTGKLITADDINTLPIYSSTRLIENPPVENALSAPIKIFFDPSLDCPLYCNFCLAGVSTKKGQQIRLPRLSKEQTEFINEQLINMGVLQIKIGGGEPFIYEPFWSSIEQLGRSGIALSTSTSGITLNNPRLLPKEKIALLKQNNVKISISIDGEPSYHDQIRGKKGLLEMALKGKERLLQHGYDPRKIELRATIINTLESMQQVEYLNQLSLDLRTRVRIRVAKPSGSATVNGAAVIYPDKNFWQFFENLRRLAEENPLLDIDEIFCYDKEPNVKTALDCGAGTRSAFIDANGNFLPCGFIAGSFSSSPHNIFDEGRSLLEIWQEGEAFKEVRSYIQKENDKNPCASCGYVHSCQGGCPSIRLQTKTEIDPRCPIEKKVYIPVKLKKREGDSIVFAQLTTGSILHYRPNNSNDRYIVLTAEEKKGVLIVGTPGGKMNGILDKSLFDTSLREIYEETGIASSDLFPIKSRKRKKLIISNPEDAKNLRKFELDGLSQYEDPNNRSRAIILNIPGGNHAPSIISVFEYETSKQPQPTSETPTIILFPENQVGGLSKVENIDDLISLGIKILSAKPVNEQTPIKFIGTTQAIITNKFFLN